MENGDVRRGDANVIVRSLLDSVEKKRNITNKYSPSIYIAPSSLRNLSEISFKPRVVSIGPLHRKDENLQAFEGRKADFVHHLFRRLGSSLEETLQGCVEQVAASIEQIKGCYAELMETYSDNELTEMMVMDAFFILNFIHQLPESKFEISKINLLDHHIPYDLVLLENQIPFFVLDTIFQRIILQFELNVSLIEFICPLLKFPNLFHGKIKIGTASTTPDHILGLLHNCYKPSRSYLVSSYFPSSTIHSAVDLHSAGVRFKPHQNKKWHMAMEVKKHGFSCFSWSWIKPTLSIPALRVNHFTELVLRNLIAYEQSVGLIVYGSRACMA
ncbi:putative UPF0481 protein [Tanacetum coccineum]